jgi:peptidoglycan/LPS O-acetylase OafA/YrhL
VLAVVGFHEGASELTGGFLGVDVFFVLSGFLITDLLVTQYDRLGRLDLGHFWMRRARRLLPALAVMLAVVTAAATVIEPDQGASLRLALLAAVTYTSNWYQIIHHVSYFASLGLFKDLPPLDHLWSLAIEEQFYLIWPLLLWLLIFLLNGRRARVTATLILAAASALAMALEYSPGDPSLVYYGTDTHASALLIGAALALALPLATLASPPAAQVKRLDTAGVVGLVVLAWAAGHFTGDDRAVYPGGLILAALGAACLVAAAASSGVIAAITSLPPLRWVGIRSYGIYLWHWPVIALTGALTGPGPTSPWLWLIEDAVTVGLAWASWRFIETPILRDGFWATCKRWWLLLREALRPPAGLLLPGRTEPVNPRRRVPVMVAAGAMAAVAVAGYGIGWPASAAPAGLLRQVAQGQQVSAASEASPTSQASPTSRASAASQANAASRTSPATHASTPAQASTPTRTSPASTPAQASPASTPAQTSPATHTSAPAQTSPATQASTAPIAPGAYTSPVAAAGVGPSTTPAPVLACGDVARPPKVSGRQVMAIGDSVMVASAAALQAAMPGIYINASVGRSMVAGLAVIQDLAAQHALRRYVIVGLATNGPVSMAQIRQLRSLIGPRRDLILVNTFGPMPWESEVNSVLAAAARQMPGVSLADWHQAIADHTALLWPDGIHPQPSGARLYARVVLAAVQADLPRVPVSLCGQPVTGVR